MNLNAQAQSIFLMYSRNNRNYNDGCLNLIVIQLDFDLKPCIYTRIYSIQFEGVLRKRFWV